MRYKWDNKITDPKTVFVHLPAITWFGRTESSIHRVSSENIPYLHTVFCFQLLLMADSICCSAASLLSCPRLSCSVVVPEVIVLIGAALNDLLTVSLSLNLPPPWPVFKWLTSGLVFWGVMVFPGLENIMNVNLWPLIQKIKSNLFNWSTLDLIDGKDKYFKMIVVPQMNYVTYMLSLEIWVTFYGWARIYMHQWKIVVWDAQEYIGTNMPSHLVSYLNRICQR